MILNKLNHLSEMIQNRKMVLLYRKKIQKIISGLDIALVEIDKNELTVRKYLPKYSNTNWHTTYASLNGIISADYLPEDLYYAKIEPKLNNRAYSSVYLDKSCLGFILDEEDHIGNAFFYNHGKMYDHKGHCTDLASLKKWVMGQDEIVLKPSKESGGGRDILIGRGEDIFHKILQRHDSYVIQKYFKQHHSLAKFHKDSMNTIRLMTLRNDGKIFVLSGYLRMGLGTSRIDNATNGGIFVAINNGSLKKTAFNHAMTAFTEHPDTHITFSGMKVPSWEEIIDTAIRNHKKLTELDVISWDFTVDENGVPKIVEINIFDQDINPHQIVNGPIFGPHLDYMFSHF